MQTLYLQQWRLESSEIVYSKLEEKIVSLEFYSRVRAKTLPDKDPRGGHSQTLSERTTEGHASGGRQSNPKLTKNTKILGEKGQ